MTKEELEKEAEEKAGIYFNNLEVDHGNVSDNRFSGYDVFVAYKKGALDFAGPREKRITELETQIEKMKNCRNCKNEKIEGACGHFTQVGWCKNWELAD